MRDGASMDVRASGVGRRASRTSDFGLRPQASASGALLRYRSRVCEVKDQESKAQRLMPEALLHLCHRKRARASTSGATGQGPFACNRVACTVPVSVSVFPCWASRLHGHAKMSRSLVRWNFR